MRIVVYHQEYGCDSGCCGHVISTDAPLKVKANRSEYTFQHPYAKDHLEWAKQLVADTYGEEHVKDLDWENCRVSED